MNELLIAVVGAILSALVAYPLGRAQGKQQTVFEEQAKIMVELRRLVMEVDKALFFAATFPDEKDSQDELGDKIVALGDYHQEKCIWLDRELNTKIGRIIGGYDDQARALVTGHHGIPPPPHLRGMDTEGVYEKVRKWYWDEGQALVEELETEARKLLGVDSRPWWRRMVRG
ncbi:MAG: hypothetical protein M3441_27740 [Chloroflexota bacterium]|nr:hypothetical protein [Chloroflexota bacterium]